MTSSNTGQQNWSDLPHDILLLISSKLASSLLNMLSLKGVCSSWRIAMRNRTKRSYPTILVEFTDSLEREGKFIKIGSNDFYLHIVNEKIPYKLKNTHKYVDQGSSEIIGSHPDGWVIVSDKYRVLYLFHLILQIKIELPDKIIVPDGRQIQVEKWNIGKAIVSTNDPNQHQDFIVLMRYRYDIVKPLLFAFCRHGDSIWSCFEFELFVDDIAIRNNTIYATASKRGYCDKCLVAWEWKSDMLLPEKKFCISLQIPLYNHFRLLHLVVPSTDDIFVVSIGQSSSCFKLDLAKKQVRKLYLFDNQTLLSCYGDSLILSSIGHQPLGYKADTTDLTQKQQHFNFGNCCVDPHWNLKPYWQPEFFWMVLTI